MSLLQIVFVDDLLMSVRNDSFHENAFFFFLRAKAKQKLNMLFIHNYNLISNICLQQCQQGRKEEEEDAQNEAREDRFRLCRLFTE